MEIHEMDISISKTMTKESMILQRKTKIFACVVALKRAIFSGSIKSHFKITLELFTQERIKDVI